MPIPEDGDIKIESESDSANKLKKIKAKLKACEKERKEYLDGWQRAKADFVNYKNNAAEKHKNLINFANKNFVLELLAVLDGFHRAMLDKKLWESAPKNWRSGIEHIHAQFMDILKSHGVEVIESVGSEFNPSLHEAVGEKKVDTKNKSGIIISETLQGYMMHGVLLRPAHVIIGKYE